MKRRILAIALCLTMVLTSGSFAFAETDATAPVAEDTSVTMENTEEDVIYETDPGDIIVEDFETSEEPYVKPVNYTDASSVLNFKNDITTFRMRSWQGINHEDIHTSKTLVYDPSTGKYTIKLEAYLEGEPATKERIPSDIVLVVDQSTSMSYCFECGGYLTGEVRHYTGINQNTRYYVKAKSTDTKGTKVYYCAGSNNTSCALGHTSGGWFSLDHSSADVQKNGKRGDRYVPSIGDARDGFNTFTEKAGGAEQIIYARIFYTDQNLTTKSGNMSSNYPVNSSGKPDGTYYRNKDSNDSYRDNMQVLSWCANHGAWHDYGASCSKENPNKLWYVPTANSTDPTYGCESFYIRDRSKHYVKPSDVEKDKTGTYLVRKSGSAWRKGYVFVAVTYKNGKWMNSDNTKEYVPATADNASSGNERQFFRPCSYYGSRYNALIDALEAFTQSIYEYSETYNVRNRLALATFGNPNQTWLLGIGDGTPVLHKNATAENYASALHFVNEDNGAGQQAINTAITKVHNNGGGTYTHQGLELASGILANAPDANDNGLKRNKIVILFTDGQPQAGTADNDSFGGADRVLDQAYAIKSNNATFYTIGIFSDADASYRESVATTTNTGNISGKDAINKLMHLASSNFIGEATMANTYSVTDLRDGFYLSAGDKAGLMEAFLGIAEKINEGASGLEVLDGDSVVRDVISAEFQVDVDANREISFHTEECIGRDDDGNYIFRNDNNKDIDSAISLKKNGTGGDKTVEVTGFNFSENYVAIDETLEDNPLPRGRKLVIEIPIELDPSAVVDSTAVATNDADASGIFKDYTLYENFDRPVMDVPTNVTITKQTVGANVPADQKFAFNVNYTAFNGYKENDSAKNGNYLEANAESTTYSRELSGVAENDKYSDRILFDRTNHVDSTGFPVVVGTEMVITETVSDDYEVEYSLDGGTTWKKATRSGDKCIITETVTSDMNIIVRNTLQRADLVINKAIDGNTNPEQSFIFNVSGGKDVDLEVVIPASEFISGNGSVTVKDLEVGNYTITEITDWAWRYELAQGEDASKTVNLTPAGGSVSFANKMNNIYWLSGDSYRMNYFTGQLMTFPELPVLPSVVNQ